MATSRSPQTRAEILRAAAHAFAERGYHGVSMRELARETGKAPATFYNHFDSKDDLLFRLQRDAFDVLIGAAQRAVAEHGDPSTCLLAFIANHVTYVAHNPDVMRVLVHEATALSDGRRAVVKQRKREYFELARMLIVDLFAAAGSDISPDETERATYCIFGMLNWTYGWYDPERHGSPTDLARTIHGIALRGLAAPEPSAFLARCPAAPMFEAWDLEDDA